MTHTAQTQKQSITRFHRRESMFPYTLRLNGWIWVYAKSTNQDHYRMCIINTQSQHKCALPSHYYKSLWHIKDTVLVSKFRLVCNKLSNTIQGIRMVVDSNNSNSLEKSMFNHKNSQKTASCMLKHSYNYMESYTVIYLV